MPLSPHEAKILAAIEHDLSGEDPRLAHVQAESRPAGRRLHKLPVPPRRVATLTAALLALIATHAIVDGLHPGMSAALTAVLIVPWVVSTVRAGAPQQATAADRPATNTDPSTRTSRPE